MHLSPPTSGTLPLTLATLPPTSATLPPIAAASRGAPPGPFAWAWALTVACLAGACGPSISLLGGGTLATCQSLADGLSTCPDLLGAGQVELFLASPSSNAIRSDASLAVQACGLRMDGANNACRGALEAFVGCAAPRSCADAQAACQGQLEGLRGACQVFLPAPQGPS